MTTAQEVTSAFQPDAVQLDAFQAVADGFSRALLSEQCARVAKPNGWQILRPLAQ
jgi:hypothetical protein